MCPSQPVFVPVRKARKRWSVDCRFHNHMIPLLFAKREHNMQSHETMVVLLWASFFCPRRVDSRSIRVEWCQVGKYIMYIDLVSSFEVLWLSLLSVRNKPLPLLASLTGENPYYSLRSSYSTRNEWKKNTRTTTQTIQCFDGSRIDLKIRWLRWRARRLARWRTVHHLSILPIVMGWERIKL